jgi:hypothetical protein
MPGVCSHVARSSHFVHATPYSGTNSAHDAEDVSFRRPDQGTDEAFSHADGFMRRDRASILGDPGDKILTVDQFLDRRWC